MTSLWELQNEHEVWATKNFPDAQSWEPLLGATEELGELCHAYLKRKQGIRGDEEKHRREICDAVGDIMLYLIHFCTLEHIDIECTLAEVWDDVQERDWIKNPKDGTVPTEENNG